MKISWLIYFLVSIFSVFAGFLVHSFVVNVGNDVVKDLKVQVENLEKFVKEDIKQDVDLIKDELAKLGNWACPCTDKDRCRCTDNPSAQPTQSWYQDSGNPNVFYWGYVDANGVLWYTQMSVNGIIVKSGDDKENKAKQTTHFLKK